MKRWVSVVILARAFSPRGIFGRVILALPQAMIARAFSATLSVRGFPWGHLSTWPNATE